MKYRFITPFLLASLLLTVSGMTACGGDDTGTTTPETQNNTDTDTAAVVTEETRTQHSVDTDALDFGGEELNQVAFDWQGYKHYFFAEAENGDVMNDAIYHRNRAVEEALNIRMVTEMQGPNCGEFVKNIKPVILAGDDVYDLMFNHCIDGISTYASEGYLYNLDQLPHIDMTAEWWNRTQMDVLRLGSCTYYAVNDMMIPCPYVIFFNKEMVSTFDLEDPYQLVYDGEWTLDVFESMARIATFDVDGNGKMDKNDSWGMTANELSKYISFMTGSGQFMTERDADNRVVLAINTEKTQSLIDRFATIAKDKLCYFPPSDVFSDLVTIDTGRMMFQLQDLSYAEEMRGFTVDYGILPYPKYDSEQKDYITLDWGGLMSVPCTIGNPELVGAAMELLAWESGNEVIPTYYDTVLTGKLARDADAVKMLDILFDTITYEIGGNYFGFGSGTSDLFYIIPRLAIDKKSTDFASKYKTYEKTALKTIERFYESLDETESAQ